MREHFDLRIINQSFALDVFNKIHNKCSNVHLLVVGEGDLRSGLEYKCKVLSLSDNVSFLGFRNDVNFLLQGADVLLIPSLHEGLSLVSIEAQCAGLLCIASDGVPEEAKKQNYFIFYHYSRGRILGLIIFYSYCPMNVELIRKK